MKLSLFFSLAVFAAAACDPKIDFYFLQDGSYNGDLSGENGYRLFQAWRNSGIDVLQKLFSSLPSSRIGGGVFTDKPYWYGDYCYRSTSKLGATADELLQGFEEQIKRGYEAGMGEWWPENQLGAMMRAALWDNNWDDSRKKVMFVLTDSIPNAEGFYKDAIVSDWGSMDDFNSVHTYISPNPLSDNFTWPTSNPDSHDPSQYVEDVHCFDYEYPSWTQWAEVMNAKDILPVFLVTEPEFQNQNDDYEIAKELKEISDTENQPGFLDPVNGLVNYYTYFLKKVNVGGIVMYGSNNYDYVSNFEASMEKLIDTVATNVCDSTTTTKAPTSTTEASTTTTEALTTTTKISTTTTKASTTTTKATTVTTESDYCDDDFCENCHLDDDICG